MIKPTIGRIVHYHQNGSSRSPLCYDLGQPHAAIIAFVHTDIWVTLTVMGHDGVARPIASVQLVQPGEPTPIPGHDYCTWMPYQMGQAAKTESLEAQLQLANLGQAS